MGSCLANAAGCYHPPIVVDSRTLKREHNLNDADLGRVVERAAQLQRQAADDRAAAVDVVAVAGELDLEKKYVEAALAELEAKRKQEAEAQLRAARRRKHLTLIGLAVLALLAVGTAVGARGAAGRMQSASDELAAAEARLQGALARQANLTPQLVALSGGDPKPLLEEARVVIQAKTAAERLEAADVFAASISRALANLPKAAADDSRSLNLQHEVAGAQNRITTERSRYEAAVARMLSAQRGLLAGVARAFGWSPAGR